MPSCPPKTDNDRNRWENVAGKALKDWVTRVMLKEGKTRDEARKVVLERITAANVQDSIPN